MGTLYDERPHDDAAAAWLLPYAHDLGLDADWRWNPGTLRGIAEAATDSSPGLDGLEYSFWARAPDETLQVLDGIATAAQDGVDIPECMHSCRFVSHPRPSSLLKMLGPVPPRRRFDHLL